MANIHVLPVPPPLMILEGLWHFSRPGRFAANARATAHHLVHLVETGGYQLVLAGRSWQVEAPALIWYHGEEAVHWQGDDRSVHFMSCAFSCPGLKPPPTERRVMIARAPALHAFSDLLEAAQAVDLRGHLRLQSLACLWLEKILDEFGHDTEQSLWARMERIALTAPGGRIGLKNLAEKAGVSLSTLERSCYQEHGCSPARRLRTLRLAQVDSLVAQGGMSLSAASVRLGWSDRRSLRRSQREQRDGLNRSRKS